MIRRAIVRMLRAIARMLRAIARWSERMAEGATRCPDCGGNPYRDPPCKGGGWS